MLGSKQQQIQARFPMAEQILLMATAGAALLKKNFKPTHKPKPIKIENIKQKNTGNEL
jgi:hypothetical protein